MFIKKDKELQSTIEKIETLGKNEMFNLTLSIDIMYSLPHLKTSRVRREMVSSLEDFMVGIYKISTQFLECVDHGRSSYGRFIRKYEKLIHLNPERLVTLWEEEKPEELNRESISYRIAQLVRSVIRRTKRRVIK